MTLWPSKGFMPMRELPKPKALRRVTWSFGTLSCGLGRVHARRRTQRPGTLGAGARQHARIVGEEDDGEMEGVRELEEVRGLLGGGRVDGAGAHRRLVGDGQQGSPPEPRQGGYQRASVQGLELEQTGVIEDQLEHRTDVVGPLARLREALEDPLESSFSGSPGIGARALPGAGLGGRRASGARTRRPRPRSSPARGRHRSRERAWRLRRAPACRPAHRVAAATSGGPAENSEADSVATTTSASMAHSAP